MMAQWFGLRVALWLFLFVICYCRAAEHGSNSRTRNTSSASSLFLYPVQRIPTVPRDDAQRPPETHIAILRPPDSTNNNTSGGRTVYVLTTTDSFRVVAPPPSLSSSARLQKPSHQWIDHECLVAVNGGPFHRDGTCAGAVLLVDDNDDDNATVVLADDFGSVGLGRTMDDTMWIIGPVASKREAIEDLDLRYYVTGFDWLVYDGKVVASQFNNTTGADRAPRTAVGLTASGVLVIVVADGCQFCLHRRGLTLEQLADQMLRAGAAYAINMDGGSSSVLVDSSGAVLSRPTCFDFVAVKCERPVASVLCVGHQRFPRMQDSVLDS